MQCDCMRQSGDSDLRTFGTVSLVLNCASVRYDLRASLIRKLWPIDFSEYSVPHRQDIADVLAGIELHCPHME